MKYRRAVLAAVWVPTLITLMLPPNLSAGSFALQPGFDVAGHVTDSAGNGVEGAEIFLSRQPSARISSLSGRPSLPLAARTAADGSFVLKYLREGELTVLEVWHPDYVPRVLGPLRVSREWIPDASLTPASRLAGVVVDGDSGEPIADA